MSHVPPYYVFYYDSRIDEEDYKEFATLPAALRFAYHHVDVEGILDGKQRPIAVNKSQLDALKKTEQSRPFKAHKPLTSGNWAAPLVASSRRGRPRKKARSFIGPLLPGQSRSRRGSKTAGYCRICKGPHVYKHGRA